VTYGSADETPAHIEFLERLYRQTAHARSKGFDMRVNKLEDNTDFIPPLALEEGLAGLFDRYRVPLDRAFASLDEIEAHYDRLSRWYGFDVAPSEIIMSFSADMLLAKDEVDRAVEILKRAITLYPKRLNAWWRLANIAAGSGDTDRAIELYRKCAEIDPSVQNFLERRIESLKRDG
jgi:tetratricopeptide (TPR) repeat protein